MHAVCVCVCVLFWCIVKLLMMIRIFLVLNSIVYGICIVLYYSGTSLLWTPLGHVKLSWLNSCPYFGVYWIKREVPLNTCSYTHTHYIISLISIVVVMVIILGLLQLYSPSTVMKTKIISRPVQEYLVVPVPPHKH